MRSQAGKDEGLAEVGERRSLRDNESERGLTLAVFSVLSVHVQTSDCLRHRWYLHQADRPHDTIEPSVLKSVLKSSHAS